ncbi:hypothetical protein KEM48_009603 [Puccinia striiformis f. sp. tritici PST-130]|nr:hypothetical protein KEM48_009603 [Puccinia striiformis f. sp. tritici PST-130]
MTASPLLAKNLTTPRPQPQRLVYFDLDHTPSASEAIMNQPEPPSPPPGSSPSSRPAQNHYLLGIGLLLIVVALWVGSSFLMSLIRLSCIDIVHVSRRGMESTLACDIHLHFFIQFIPCSSWSILSPFSFLSATNSSSSFSKQLQTITLVNTLVRLVLSSKRPQSIRKSSSMRYPSILYPRKSINDIRNRHLASTFVLLWFAANWSVNAALGYTTVSSTTILSSMSGFFTLAIGVLTGAEKYSFGRLVAVITSIAGVILVSKSDRNLHSIHDMPSGKNLPPPSEHWILGDLLALSSAALYALYVILMKVKVKEESRVDMQLFFGFVGVINMLCFWPMGVILHYTDIEPFSFPQTHKLWISVILNAMCTFVSDYIYMLAMLKTSPLVVTLGISLTLPVAVIGDIFKGINLPPTSLIGAGLVLSSFVILSLFEQHHS